MDELLKQYRPMVRRIAYHMGSKLAANIELDDLFQEGMIALMDCIQRYEEENKAGASFESFATHRVRGAMLDSMRKQDVLSRHHRTIANRIEVHRSTLAHKLGHEPSPKDIAGALGMELSAYHEWSRVALSFMHVSAEDMVDEIDFTIESFPDHAPCPRESLEREQRLEGVIAAFHILSARDQLILDQRYTHDRSLEEVGKMLGVGESRACQLEKQAIQRLSTRCRGH